VISKQEALARAKEEGKDLVEIVPQGKPPVAKIISWSKLKYEQEKKKKASKAKAQEQKEIWFKSFIGEGDIQHKLKKVQEFIEKKHSVKLTIKQRGRRVNRELLLELMKKLIAYTSEYATPVAEPKFNGPNFSVIVMPKKH
jgi:translation initiation factor IF-3